MQTHVVTARAKTAAAALFLTAACSAQQAQTSSAALPKAPDKPVVDNAAPAPVAPSAIAPPKVAKPESASAPPSPAADAPIEDLLRVTHAAVNVSSTVENARNHPEHLVDYDPSTAWQGLTGQLTPWIKVTLPQGVRVERFELTAGFTKSVGNQDAFTQNHRITEVEVKRDGVQLGRYLLDPMQRELQTLPVTGNGGIYEIHVIRVLPGTRPEWREVAISELRVMGQAATEVRRSPAPPPVEVGDLDHTTVLEMNQQHASTRVAGAPAVSIAALCDKFIAEVPLTYDSDGVTLQRSGPPTCKLQPVNFALPKSNTFLGLWTVKTFDGFTRATDIVVRLPRGYVSLPVWLGVDSPDDPGCPSVVRPDEINSIRIENDYLVLQLSAPDEVSAQYADADGKPLDKPVIGRQFGGAVWCKEADSKLSCTLYDPPAMVYEFSRFRIMPDGLLHPNDPPSNP